MFKLGRRMGIRARSALISAVFRKAMSLDMSSASAGQLQASRPLSPGSGIIMNIDHQSGIEWQCGWMSYPRGPHRFETCVYELGD